MKRLKGSPEDEGLLFDWPSRHRVEALLPAAMFVALLACLSAFWLFDVAYPPAQGSLLRPAAIAFLPLDPRSYPAVRAWIEGNDPAILSPATMSQNFELPPLAYVPTFDKTTTPALPLPETTRKRLWSDLEWQIPGLKTASPPIAAAASVPVEARFTENLQALSPTLPAWTPQAPAGDAIPQAAEYFIGVLPDGSPGLVFLLTSSAVPALDDAARAWLTQARYSKASEITWGRVWIVWGNVFAAPPKR